MEQCKITLDHLILSQTLSTSKRGNIFSCSSEVEESQLERIFDTLLNDVVRLFSESADSGDTSNQSGYQGLEDPEDCKAGYYYDSTAKTCLPCNVGTFA
jgi:hypothetical protein